MFRKSNISDCERVYQLICDMEHKQLSYDKFSSIYSNQLCDKHYYCLIYESDGKVLGMLNLRFEEQLHHSECIAEIMEFAVDSSCRKQGIGKEMLAKVCDVAKDFKCIQIEVACNQLRTDTHRFYLREGMNNFHYKFSKSFMNNTTDNALGY